MKKYELTGETKVVFGRTLYRIKATIAFGDINEGDLGGFIEKEENLSHDGNAWVCDNAQVYGDARVCGDARVYGNARVCGNAWVYGDARVCGDAEVCDNAEVYGDAQVCDNAQVYGDARVCGDAQVYGDARVYGDAWVCDNAEVFRASHLLVIGPCGSRNASTTFFRNKDRKISVKCGCFLGTIDEFLTKVSETHGDNKHALVYRAAVEVAKIHIDLEESAND